MATSEDCKLLTIGCLHPNKACYRKHVTVTLLRLQVWKVHLKVSLLSIAYVSSEEGTGAQVLSLNGWYSFFHITMLSKLATFSLYSFLNQSALLSSLWAFLLSLQKFLLTSYWQATFCPQPSGPRIHEFGLHRNSWCYSSRPGQSSPWPFMFMELWTAGPGEAPRNHHATFYSG